MMGLKVDEARQAVVNVAWKAIQRMRDDVLVEILKTEVEQDVLKYVPAFPAFFVP